MQQIQLALLVVGFCEYSHKIPGTMQGKEFPDYLSNYQLLGGLVRKKLHILCHGPHGTTRSINACFYDIQAGL